MHAIIRNFSKVNVIMLVAGAVTVTLFYTMQLLIMAESGIPQRQVTPRIADITLPEIELKVFKTTPAPEAPDEPPPIPETSPRIVADGPPISTGPVVFDNPPVDVGPGPWLGPTDSNAVPIAQIQPQYPTRAAERGIEGFVIVEFDVNETGAVVDPEVLVSVPDGVFDRASLRALERWRYQPKFIDGKAVPMRGLQTKFSFNLRE